MNRFSQQTDNLPAQQKRRVVTELQQQARPTEIPRRTGSGPWKLSFAQQRLWFLDQLVPNSDLYKLRIPLRLLGPLNYEALQQSLDALVERHETLRTTFRVEDGTPFQVINQPYRVEIPRVDLTGTPQAERESEARLLAASEASRPFDLCRGPLFRAKLLFLGEQDHVLLMTIHHIVADGWSLAVLNYDFGKFYQAFCKGDPSPLPELPIQYLDFALWQRAWLDGKALANQLDYWKHNLADLSTLQLPVDRPRPAVQTFCGSSISVTLPKTLSNSLVALGRRERVTLFMTLLAAFKVLLYRYSSQDDIVVGSPIANRNCAEIESLVGFFVNMLVIRSDVSGDPSFRALLQRVREVCLDAYSNQEVPFEKLVEELDPTRDLSRSPFFQVSFALQNFPRERLELGELTTTFWDTDTEIARFDLSLFLWETAQGLHARMEYNTDLFDETTVQRMLQHYQCLLEAIERDPDRRLSQLPLMSEVEQRRMSLLSNQTGTNFHADRMVHQLVEDRAKQSPDSLAVVFEDQCLTYRELNVRANRLAHHLIRRGVEQEGIVGLCLPRGLEMVVGLVAILKAGGGFLPLDPEYPRERLKYMIEDAALPVLVTQSDLAENLCDHQVRRICLDKEWSVIARESELNPDSGTTAENLAYVIYTSGSTGMPKGTLVPHRGLCNVVQQQGRVLQVGPDDRVLQFSSLSFDASVFEMVMALGSGATLYLGSRESLLPGPNLIRFLLQREINIVTLTPSTLAALATEELPALRTISVAGEACSGELVRRWASGRRFFNLYGPTETTIWATSAHLSDPRSKPHIGRAISNVQVFVLDRHMNPVPVGVPGELYIGGTGMGRGYHRRRALTAERFVAHPFPEKPGERLYRTGDRCCWLSDGNLEFLGRLDRQVKLRGYRIELGEIEAAIRGHSPVADTVVLAREDNPGHKQLVAYVDRADGRSIDESQLRESLKQKLPSYMVPTAFVVMDSLPLTPHGKVNYAALPSPSRIHSERSAAYLAPRNELERTISVIWQELLHVDKVGIEDDFFDLGGNSLLTVTAVAKIAEATGKTLSVSTLFQAPTIKELAEQLCEETTESTASSLVPLQPAGSQPPLFCVAPFGLDSGCFHESATAVGSDQPIYGLEPGRVGANTDRVQTTEEIAAHFVKEIRVVQPHGPYHLAGLGCGGIVAWEMAQQLRVQSETEGAVTLLDTYTPQYAKRLRGNGLIRKLWWIITARVDLEVGQMILLPHLQGRAISSSRTGEPSQRIGKGANPFSRLLVRRLYGMFRLSIRRRVRNRPSQQQTAVMDYEPSAYPGRVTVLSASKQPGSLADDRTLGWGEFAQNLDLFELPGHHASITRERHVAVLAKELMNTLDRARRSLPSYSDSRTRDAAGEVTPLQPDFETSRT